MTVNIYNKNVPTMINIEHSLTFFEECMYHCRTPHNVICIHTALISCDVINHELYWCMDDNVDIKGN